MPSASPLRERTPHLFTITVLGLPAPQGSKRHVGRGILIDDNRPALRTWREDVKLAALAELELHTRWRRDYDAVVARMTFTLPRPKGHYRQGKETSHLLRDAAPRLHTTKPDLDKLLRSTWDALTAAGAYGDDSRLCQVWGCKTYPTARGLPVGALPVPGATIVLTGVDR